MEEKQNFPAIALSLLKGYAAPIWDIESVAHYNTNIYLHSEVETPAIAHLINSAISLESVKLVNSEGQPDRYSDTAR